MNLRSFNDGPRVSEIGIGCWQMGGTEWGDVSEVDALDALRGAADAGVTFIDTADIYGGGRSEELVGRFLKERGRDKFFVATKLGRSSNPGWPANFTAKVIREHTEGSLKRLGVDAVDLTQLHCVPLDVLQGEEVWDALRALKKEGKIKRFGASVESTAEAKEALKRLDCSSLQIIFNIFRQTPAFEIFDQCVKQKVAVIVRLPLASGLLAGKYTASTTFPETDHRTYNANGEKFNVGETFAGLGFKKGLELTEKLKTILPAGSSMAQLALRWCLDFPAVTTVIPGARNRAQAAGNAAASSLPAFAPELHAKLKEFFVNDVKPHVRGPD
jgi:aryl-alcohol dehydrogenase-like predicted oxidoreductase